MTYNLDTPLNPISVFLRSSDYTYTQNSDKNNLLFKLNTPIISYPNMDMLISLKSFCFTNSFYTIDENNCWFFWKTIDNPYTATSLALGIYTIDQLISYLNGTALNNYFTFSYSKQTFLLTITGKNLLEFSLVDGLNNCYEVLGFDDFGTDISEGLQTSWISPYPFNMISTQILHVTIPNLNLTSVGLKNSTHYSIIDSIQVVSSPGEVQSYLDNNNFKYKISDQSISFINVVILNQDFKAVNFHNIDWFMNLTFSFMYKKDLVSAEYITDNESSAQFYLLQAEKQKYLQEIKKLHIK